MIKKNIILTIALMMVIVPLASCGWNIGTGDERDKNIEKASLARLDSISNVEFVGLADTHDLDNNRFQAIVIYYVTDLVGNKIERNARVITNDSGSEILTWDDLDSQILNDTKQKVSAKMKEKGINIDENLIDELIDLKKQTR